MACCVMIPPWFQQTGMIVITGHGACLYLYVRGGTSHDLAVRTGL